MARQSKSNVAELLRRIPETMRFGSQEYAINKGSLPEHKNNWGELDPNKHIISIEINTPNGKRLAETIMHEGLHGIWGERYLPGTHEEEEHTVQQIAAGLVAMFVDNPWMLPWLILALRK